MKLILQDVAQYLKFIAGIFACFLILFGIHWIAILCGCVLAIMHFLIPKR